MELHTHTSATYPLKLLVTSDLHYGASAAGDRAVRSLADRACAEGADALLVGGDIAEGPTAIGECLALFDRFSGAKMAVPGNHDIWVRRWQQADSWQVHERLLPAVFEQFGFHPLHLRPAVIAGVGFVGSMGWYDYSFRDDIGIELPYYQAKTYPGAQRPLWNDARYAQLPAGDVDLTQWLDARLRRHLVEVADSRSIIALTHHVVTKRLLFHPRACVPRVWRFLNAFLGSERFGVSLAGCPRVTQVFCGHIHRARAIEHDRSTWMTIGSSYKSRELIVSDAGRCVRKQMVG